MLQKELRHDTPAVRSEGFADDCDGKPILDANGVIPAEYREASNDGYSESLTTRFNDEIDDWARRALHRNGFGDW